MSDSRIADLRVFYSLLALLEAKLGGPRRLADCSGTMPWPERGVYFFMEHGENRAETGSGGRIVRVGTHALTENSRSNLWTRLSQHRGQAKHGGGNHRGSVFRQIVGSALIERDTHSAPAWGQGSNASSDIKTSEAFLEREVSKIIGAMPFLWLAINDKPSAGSQRGTIERNAIALLSNFNKPPLDKPSVAWLGHSSNRDRHRKSGLWNSRNVDEKYDPTFLALLMRLVTEMDDSR